MSADRWIALLTEEEYEAERDYADNFFGDSDMWFDNVSVKNNKKPDNVEAFCFGATDDDVPEQVLSNIDSLKCLVDDVVALLTFLFLQGSESQQIDMFERFLTANLGKGKIVHFWSE